MNNNFLKTFSLLCCVELMQLGSSSMALADTQTDSSVSSLIKQAQYWHEKANDKLAIESLQKVLMVDANNAQALYMMSLLARQRGDDLAAAQWKKRLTIAHPDSSELQLLNTSISLQKLPKQQVDLAREQARRGDVSGSIKTWNKIFPNGKVPLSLAAEYYLTMSGDKSLYNDAVKGLRSVTKSHPNDVQLGIAYGKVLTYRERNRRQGIRILEHYAQDNKSADDALKQALLWLAPKASDKYHYQKWDKRHPNEHKVMAHYQRSTGSKAISTAFNELNRGNLAKAKSIFNDILRRSPRDADALAGLGYVYLHENDYPNAAKYLNLSAKQGGHQAAKRRKQAHEASFYADLAKAKSAYAEGDITQALLISSSLVEEKGDAGVSAKLFRADVLRHQGKYSAAEELLRQVLSEKPADSQAKESLYYVLAEQNHYDQANLLLRSMPKDFQRKVQAADKYSHIRDLAHEAIKFGDFDTATVILENGLKRIPNNPWLRLELARLYKKQGHTEAAEATIRPLERDGVSNESLYAAAIFASEDKKWRQVHDLIARVPLDKRDEKEKQLFEESGFNLSLDNARLFLAKGNKKEALSLLLSLKEKTGSNPLSVGRVAQLLMKAGDKSGAVVMVQHNIESGITSNAGDYANHVAVLYQAGLLDEAQNLLNDPRLIANSTPEQLSIARNVYVINEADHLRELGDYAPAYDMLARALQDEPKNKALMLAMARLYQSGKMNNKAMTVYRYLIDNQLDTTQEARLGAINVYLAEGEADKAQALYAQLPESNAPERLLLHARIYQAQGKPRLALAELRSARGQLLGFKSNGKSTSPLVGGMVIADNPFTSHTTEKNDEPSSSVYGTAMPWQVNGQAQQTSQNYSERTDLPALSADQQTLTEVDSLLTQIHKQNSTWVQGGIQVRNRDGESGLSKLTETRVPLQWSTVPFGHSRLAVNIDAVSLESGASSDEASRRFGTGALIQGEVAESEGVSTTSGDDLPDIDSQGAKRENGVEVKAALSGDNYDADIGTTPLGLEYVTLVGGATYKAQLSDHAYFSLTGERRSVKDSLLSYVGVKDSYSGKYWGQVTKNGIHAQLGYDDGDAGYYADAGAWKYLGHSVQDNESMEFGGGFYVRPYKYDDRSLQVGMDVRYKDFTHNLSYYSFGHGGYFSPQNYISFTIPVDYTQEYDKLSLKLGGSVGFQSYSQDKAEYFPGQSTLQSELQTYVDSGYAEEAYYSAKSTSGMGFNIHANLEYRLQADLTLQAKVSYDTFGDYNESLASIMLRRSFGGN